MLSSELIRIVKRLIAKGEDPTYEMICMLWLLSNEPAGSPEWEDFSGLRNSGNVAKSLLYTKVRKRIATLVRQGVLQVDKDGKQAIVSMAENRILPMWEIMKEHMITEYPEWFNKREGGTNPGGGYSYLFRKFYDEVEDFLN